MVNSVEHYQDLQKLRDLLEKSNFVFERNSIKIVDGNGPQGLYTRVKFKCYSYNGFSTNFETFFNNQDELKTFINDIELVNKINIMGLNYIKVVPVVSSRSFMFYLNEKIISVNELKYLYESDLQKYYQNFLNNISVLGTNLTDIHYKSLNYNSLKASNLHHIENLTAAKNMTNNFFGKMNISGKKINSYDIYTLVKEMFIIDFKEILKIIQENDVDKLNKIFNDFSNAVLTGKVIKCQNMYDFNSFEDIYSLNKFIEIIVDKISHIENNLDKKINLENEKNVNLHKIIDQINDTSFSNLGAILNNLDILKEEKEENIINNGIRNFNDLHPGYVPSEPKKENNYFKEVYQQIQIDQEKKLTKEEIIAVNLYKTQLYRAFNPVIIYQRKTGIEYDETVEKYIYDAWDELKEQVELSKSNPFYLMNSNNSSQKMIAEEFLSKYSDSLPPKDEYTRLILTYIPHLISALNKIILSDDIIVYRGSNNDYEPLGNDGIISTSLSKDVAKEFIGARDLKSEKTGNLYKIIIPKGSPIICFTSELMSGKHYNNPILDSQKEILIDTSLYDFKFVNSIEEVQSTNEKNKFISFQIYVATPKNLELSNKNIK